MYRLIAFKKPNGEFEALSQVERLEDGAVIPFNTANRDYIKYLEWLAEGNIPEPWESE